MVGYVEREQFPPFRIAQGGYMGIQYVTDEQGNPVAVQVPIAEWEAIQERIKEPNAETIAAMEEARHPEKLKRYATPEAMWADMEKAE